MSEVETAPEPAGAEAPPAPAADGKPRPEPRPEPKAPDVEAPRAPEGTLISAEQLERFRQAERERDALRAVEEARAEEARKADEARLIEEGKLKEVIAKKDEELARRETRARDTEARFKSTVRDKELAVELARHPLTKFGAEHLQKLWRDDLETVPDGDGFKVQTRDGKPVDKFVAENLKSERYFDFIPPASRGGSGSQGTERRSARDLEAIENPSLRVLRMTKESMEAKRKGVIGL